MNWIEFLKPKKYLRLITLLLVFVLVLIFVSAFVLSDVAVYQGSRPSTGISGLLLTLAVFFGLLLILYLPACIISYILSKKNISKTKQTKQ